MTSTYYLTISVLKEDDGEEFIDVRNISSNLKLEVRSIDRFGLVTVKFSDKIIVPQHY